MKLTEVFQRQLSAVRNNLVAAALVFITVLGVLYLAYVHDEMVKAVAYLSAMWLCTLVTDLFTIDKKVEPLPVKKPVSEALLSLALPALGILGMLLRFVWLDWTATPGIIKLSAAILLICCAYPIALAAILLFVYKYKLRELGFRISPLIWVGVAILAITAITAFVFASKDFTFDAMMQETGGIAGMFLAGFIMAALPEEFSRLVIQTRVGTLLRNNALGWFIACAMWAFMHTPKWYGDSHDIFESVMGAVRIIPLGLMWSYMIHRTKNIFPSIIAHGLNLWGLQNF